MKRTLMWVMLIIAIGLSVSASVVVYDSREYVAEYFQVKKEKLHLASESSVDSMLTVIEEQKQIIDSVAFRLHTTDSMLVSVSDTLKNLEFRYRSLESTSERYRQSIINLNGIIQHQNAMMEKLMRTNQKVSSVNCGAAVHNPENAVSQPDHPSVFACNLYITSRNKFTHRTGIVLLNEVSQPDWPVCGVI